MRLIDADKLSTSLVDRCIHSNSGKMFYADALDLIDDQPTVSLAKFEQLKHDNELLLEQLRILKSQMVRRPKELYAVEDCLTGDIIFNARGGCYKDIDTAQKKLDKLSKSTGRSYRIVAYKLSV